MEYKYYTEKIQSLHKENLNLKEEIRKLTIELENNSKYFHKGAFEENQRFTNYLYNNLYNHHLIYILFVHSEILLQWF